MRTAWETIKDLYRLRETSILCTQAASILFKSTNSTTIWRLWTKRSKNPNKKRGRSDGSGLSRPRTKGKKKKMQTRTNVSRTKVKEQYNKLITLRYNIELDETGELQSHTNTQEHHEYVSTRSTRSTTST